MVSSMLSMCSCRMLLVDSAALICSAMVWMMFGFRFGCISRCIRSLVCLLVSVANCWMLGSFAMVVFSLVSICGFWWVGSYVCSWLIV